MKIIQNNCNIKLLLKTNAKQLEIQKMITKRSTDKKSGDESVPILQWFGSKSFEILFLSSKQTLCPLPVFQAIDL